MDGCDVIVLSVLFPLMLGWIQLFVSCVSFLLLLHACVFLSSSPSLFFNPVIDCCFAVLLFLVSCFLFVCLFVSIALHHRDHGFDWVGLGWVGLDWIGLDFPVLFRRYLGWFASRQLSASFIPEATYDLKFPKSK